MAGPHGGCGVLHIVSYQEAPKIVSDANFGCLVRIQSLKRYCEYGLFPGPTTSDRHVMILACTDNLFIYQAWVSCLENARHREGQESPPNVLGGKQCLLTFCPYGTIFSHPIPSCHSQVWVI